jgi:hypothetical protein
MIPFLLWTSMNVLSDHLTASERQTNEDLSSEGMEGDCFFRL